jgi:hypothetical protein
MLLSCKSDANEASSRLVSSGAAVKSGWYEDCMGLVPRPFE